MEKTVLDNVFQEIGNQTFNIPPESSIDVSWTPTLESHSSHGSRPCVQHQKNKISPKKGKASRAGELYQVSKKRSTIVVFLCGFTICLIGSFFFLLKDLNNHSLASNQSPLEKPNYTHQAKKIEDIRVGDRVLGANPYLDDVDRNLPDPDPHTWAKIVLRLNKQNGKALEIELLRPLHWLEGMKAKLGGGVYLDLREMGAVGWADIMEIRPCPPIAAGKGNVVTGTFKHENDSGLINIRLKGMDDVIACTKNHPFWSEDRQDFVAAEDLHTGERLRSRNTGVVNIESISFSPKTQWVYNLEVHREHVYEVSKQGILVHNTCPIPANAQTTLNTVRTTGQPPSGYKGGGTFMNDGRGGGQVLPGTTSGGAPITYREYDVNPYTPGVNRGAERIVVGSDGRAYYTNDHYMTFTEIK